MPAFTHKNVVREQMKAARREAFGDRPDAAIHAARIFFDAIIPPDTPQQNLCIGIYFPIHHELDTAPLIDELRARNISVALPIISSNNAPLIFRIWEKDQDLIKGKHNIPVPPQSASSAEPSIIIAPLIAFDKSGNRLGYGGGYYDRTLAHYRSQKDILFVGYAFGAQGVDVLPTDPLDQPLDWIITERGAVRFTH